MLFLLLAAVTFAQEKETPPKITLPEIVYILDGNDLVVTHEPKFILVEQPTTTFKILLDDQRMKNFVPKEKVWPVLLGILSGTILSVVADEILPLRPFAKQAAAAGISTAGGIVVWWIFK
jgi:hypothetical protein